MLACNGSRAVGAASSETQGQLMGAEGRGKIKASGKKISE